MPDIAGLKLIVPTSATATGAGSSATVSATGKVTFTTVTALSVNGCFTSAYDNYLIVARGKGPDVPDNRFRLRASGTDATGSNYTQQSLGANSTTVSGGRSTSDRAVAGSFDTTDNSGYHYYVYGPNLAQPTAMRNISAWGYLGAYILDFAATHSLSTAYDGFTIFPQSSTMTGALCVYGLAQ